MTAHGTPDSGVDGPNVLWIVLDAARAKNFQIYGHDRPTAPNIDDLSLDATVFERAISPSGNTIDSVTSILAGEYPIEHQSGQATHVNATNTLLPTALSEAGYTTAMITSNPFITPQFGFEADEFYPLTHPFENGNSVREFFSRTNHLPKYRRYPKFFREALGANFFATIGNALQFKYGLFTGPDDGAKKATRQTLEFIEETDDPWMVYTHFTETHMNDQGDLPYLIPEDDAYRFIDDPPVTTELQSHVGPVAYDDEQMDIHERLYDGSIHYLDDQVGRILDRVHEEGLWDETLVVVTADHGELLGEHDLLGHGQLFEESVHVPLVVKFPEQVDGDRVSERVSLTWLYQTIFDETGVDGPDGRTVSLSAPDKFSDHVLTQDYSSTWDWSRYGDEDIQKHAIYEGCKKLITDFSQHMLFDLDSDPTEQRDLSDEDPDEVRRLTAELETVLNELRDADVSTGQTDEIGEFTRSRLEDLGYLE